MVNGVVECALEENHGRHLESAAEIKHFSAVQKEEALAWLKSKA